MNWLKKRPTGQTMFTAKGQRYGLVSRKWTTDQLINLPAAKALIRASNINELKTEKTRMARAKRIAHRLGLSVSDRRKSSYRGDVVFENKTIILSDDSVILGKAAEFVQHDICHWLVATPAERRLPNFGLGRIGNSKGIDYRQELRTCVLEQLLSVVTRISTPMRLFNLVSYPDFDSSRIHIIVNDKMVRVKETVVIDEWANDFNWLIRRKLIDVDGNPTIPVLIA